MMKDFYVYMMSNKKQGVIYKGVTSNLVKRVWEHKNEIGCSFTSKYKTKRLVWYKQCGNWEDAIQWEKRLRAYPRQWKVNLIEEENLYWNDLYNEITGTSPVMTKIEIKNQEIEKDT